MEEIESESEFYCGDCLAAGRRVREAFGPPETAFLIAASIQTIRMKREQRNYDRQMETDAMSALGKLLVALGPGRKGMADEIGKKIGVTLMLSCTHKLAENPDA